MRAAEIVGLIALVLLISFVVVVTLRRAVLARSGGFNVSWRINPTPDDRGWSLGQARYRGSRLCLYRSFSPLPTPAITLYRSRLSFGSAREPIGTEPDLLPSGAVIVRCTHDGQPWELALSTSARTALRSWVESRPPGSLSPDQPHRSVADGAEGRSDD